MLQVNIQCSVESSEHAATFNINSKGEDGQSSDIKLVQDLGTWTIGKTD